MNLVSFELKASFFFFLSFHLRCCLKGQQNWRISVVYIVKILETICCSCLVAKSYPTLLLLYCSTQYSTCTVACQAPLPMEFSRQEYWSGLPLLHQEIFLTHGLIPCLLHWQADSLPLSHVTVVYPHNGYTIGIFRC